MSKINHRLKPVFLFLKKSRISAFFYSPFLPNPNGQFCALPVLVMFSVPARAINASINCCIRSLCPSGTTVEYASSCTNSVFCNSCKDNTLTSGTGVDIHYIREMQFSQSVSGSVCTITPRCEIISTTYECASGYYGTATSSTSGCTKCPANALCLGGNGSTFRCNIGYQKDGNECVPIECNAGDYYIGGFCRACPSPGTSAGGLNGITSCYVTGGSDTTGSYSYTQNCYYSN